jgi:hypothetical protein
MTSLAHETFPNFSLPSSPDPQAVAFEKSAALRAARQALQNFALSSSERMMQSHNSGVTKTRHVFLGANLVSLSEE